MIQRPALVTDRRRDLAAARTSLGQGHRPDHSAIAFRPAAVIFTQNNFGGLPLVAWEAL
jgi:hypothetical protein